MAGDYNSLWVENSHSERGKTTLSAKLPYNVHQLIHVLIQYLGYEGLLICRKSEVDRQLGWACISYALPGSIGGGALNRGPALDLRQMADGSCGCDHSIRHIGISSTRALDDSDEPGYQTLFHLDWKGVVFNETPCRCPWFRILVTDSSHDSRWVGILSWYCHINSC
jgi:hypothetical protein